MSYHFVVRFVVLVAIGYACPSARAADAMPVQVTLPRVGTQLQLLELTGTFTAQRAAAISPRISGLVADVAVEAGDRVAEKHLLVQLDPRLAEIDVAQARALLAERTAAADEARRRAQEGERLGRTKHLPETEVRALASASAIADAAVRRAQSELDAARERLVRHAVVAPFAGTIVAKRTEAGEWVQTGTAVVDLVDTAALWFDVQVPQERWPAFDDLVEATIRVDALPQASLAARLRARVPASDPSNRTFLARFTIDDLPGGITPGMSARASIELIGDRRVLILPRDALIRYPDGRTTVWVLELSGEFARVQERPVSLGRLRGDEIEVLDGLNASQPVVTRGNEGLVDQQIVRVVERT